MAEDYTALPDDEVARRAASGDHAAHFEQGRRSALGRGGKPPAPGKGGLRKMRQRFGWGGILIWLIFQAGVRVFGPACVAGLLYIAYYAADEVYFGYHDYSWVERGLWYIGTFLFIGLMLRLSTIATRYLLKRRPFSTLLILIALCWYLYESAPLDRFWPQ